MQFTTRQILNITTDELCSSMEDIYSLLGYMMNKDLRNNQILPAADKCKPVLLALYPQFSELSNQVLEMSRGGSFSFEKLDTLVASFEAQHGTHFEVQKL